MKYQKIPIWRGRNASLSGDLPESAPMGAKDEDVEKIGRNCGGRPAIRSGKSTSHPGVSRCAALPPAWAPCSAVESIQAALFRATFGASDGFLVPMTIFTKWTWSPIPLQRLYASWTAALGQPALWWRCGPSTPRLTWDSGCAGLRTGWQRKSWSLQPLCSR